MPYALALTRARERDSCADGNSTVLLPACQIFPRKFAIFKKLFLCIPRRRNDDSGTYFRILLTLRAKDARGEALDRGEATREKE